MSPWGDLSAGQQGTNDSSPCPLPASPSFPHVTTSHSQHIHKHSSPSRSDDPPARGELLTCAGWRNRLLYRHSSHLKPGLNFPTGCFAELSRHIP